MKEDYTKTIFSPEIIETFKCEINPLIEKNMGALVMTEIKEIAIDLMNLGDKFNEKTLRNMGEDLLNYAQIYDIDKIKKEINKISIFSKEVVKRSNNYA